MFDAIDRRILALLQQNARISNADIARDLGMAPSAVFERMRKLEAKGVITHYEARLDAKALGFGLVAFVFVRADEIGVGGAIGAALAAIPEAQEVHQVVGDDGFLVKLRARDTEDLGRLLRERFAGIPGLRGTRATIVLDTLRETAQLPFGLAPVPRFGDSAASRS